MGPKLNSILIFQGLEYNLGMKILAIETSCDDTGIAVLQANSSASGQNFEVLSNVVASQIEIHKKYGGVFPMMAKREHQANLLPTLITALKKSYLLKAKSKTKNSKEILNSKIKKIEKILDREPALAKKLIPFLENYEKPNVDLIAVTNGPGLEPCLWVGVNFARVLSYFWNIPIVPVNHIESHILVNYLNNHKIALPALALVVSGGHTQLILVKGIRKYKILGETRDDAAGECFDKCAKILGLPYPGGPEISKLAQGIKTKNLFPRPMINTKDYDFSFSGLKTAVLYYLQKNKNQDKKQMSAEVQQAIIDVLIKKTLKAAKDYKVKTLILGGGVSANQELKKQFEKAVEEIDLIFPPANLSTDNGLMIAVTAWFHHKKTAPWKTLKANANLRID